MLKVPPLSLYIHFPWCVRKCPYCDFNSHTLRTELPESLYIDALIADLDQQLTKIGNPILISIFMGGGTPSLFSGRAITHLLRAIKQRAVFTPDIEITLEANPGTSEYGYFAAYREAGINRLSLGIQSFQDQQLQQLGRIHSAAEAHQAILSAKAAGFTNVNFDVMHGLPGQSIQEGLDDLNTALQYQPNHVSWYQLTLEPYTEFAIRPPRLPSDETIWALQQRAQQYFKKNAYTQYEISAYSRPAAICRHNRNYWEFGDYIGIGAGAHSKITDAKHQHIIRIQKHKNPKRYLQEGNDFIAEEKVVQTHELPFEFMLNACRLYQPIAIELFEQRTGLAFTQLEKPLREAEKLALVRVSSTHIHLRDKGKRFYNDLISLFLA